MCIQLKLVSFFKRVNVSKIVNSLSPLGKWQQFMNLRITNQYVVKIIVGKSRYMPCEFA